MKALSITLLALAAVCAVAAEVRWETRFVGERTLLFRNGAEFDFRACLADQLRRHRAMKAEDALKQCFQAAFGPEHILDRTDAARQRFDAEFAAVAPRPDKALYEIISPDFMRVDLGAWKAAKLPPEWLFRLFAASARKFADGDEFFRRCLAAAEDALDGEEKLRFAALPKKAAPHHSAAWHAAEAPSYRLVSTRFLNALPVLLRAAAIPEREGEVRIIAIDGRAASGKTTLARQLALALEADVVHMDDFFLPAELRTSARYAEPGGNLHYERFREEVLPRLRSPQPFSYGVFDCSTMRIGKPAEIRSRRWRIVEGAYSLHPKFGDYADCKVFYTISPEEQMRRIRARNGERRAQVFRERWIPLEELYIRNCDPIRRADLVIGGAPRPAAGAGESAPRFTRVFCWGYPVNDSAAQRYAEAGVTDLPVRSRKEFDLAVKYGMTPYADCFLAVGPHRQAMTPEEEAFSSCINGKDLDPALPRAERSRIIHRRRIEKQHRYGGDSVVDPDTLRCDLPCFISDTDLAITRQSIDELLARAVPGVKGIYLDYIGYTNHRGCYCDGCLAKLRSFLAERRLADTPENRAVFYRGELVRYCNRVIGYIKSRRPDFKIVIHIYPEFRPDPLYGNRVAADFCGQTVAWYFKWPPEKIARCTRFVVEHARDHHPSSVGIPFLGVSSSPNGSLAAKSPAEVEAELETILAAGGRTLMVCNGPVMIQPGYFEIFRRYCGPRTAPTQGEK